MWKIYEKINKLKADKDEYVVLMKPVLEEIANALKRKKISGAIQERENERCRDRGQTEDKQRQNITAGSDLIAHIIITGRCRGLWNYCSKWSQKKAE